MTDHEHALELINAEIDGVLSGPQRAELNRLLLADPAIRALRDELAGPARRSTRCRVKTCLPACTLRSSRGLPVATPGSHAVARRTSFPGVRCCGTPPRSRAACWSVLSHSSSTSSMRRKLGTG